jgi:hypothetical protein
MTVIEHLKQMAQGNSEILEFINGPIKARLDGKNPQYPIPSQTEVEHVVDYLVNRAVKGRKLKLKKASYEQMRDKAEEWIVSLNKKADGIVETEEDVEVIKQWKSGMKLVKLVGENAYKREGKLMSHCVSSYFRSSEARVYSIRDANNNPHCTMEVTSKGDSVNQIKGKGNGSIHPKYVDYVLKSLKLFGITVRGSELSNLGYVELSERIWTIYDYCFDGVKYLQFGGQRYYYTSSKPVLKIEQDKATKFVIKMYEGL